MNMVKYILWGMVSCVFIWLPVSCTPVLKVSQVEPSAIYIRNSSDEHIDSIRIRGERGHERGNSVGGLSPLPAGVTQVLGRPSNPPKLPGKLIVCWEKSGGQICQAKDIEGILKGLGSFDTALVFDIQPQSTLNIYLEPLK